MGTAEYLAGSLMDVCLLIRTCGDCIDWFPEAACRVCQDWPWPPVAVSDYSTVVVEVVAVVEGS